MPEKLWAPALFLLLVCPAAAQDTPLRQAARLDAEQNCAGAERIYQQILAQGPASPQLLNNLGNHYLLCGEPDKARVYFERLLKANPLHPNANLQLARIAADRHQGSLALEYLARVKDTQPPTQMLRAEALHWAGKHQAALATLAAVEKETAADPRLQYLYGITCARLGAYERAVTAFTAVLATHPDDVDVLLNLGRAAARAKQYDRAVHALEVALKLQPDNVDALMELAAANVALHDYARAVYVLVQARKLVPTRPEIVLALAHAAQAGEFYGDAVLAYDEYLRLKPDDDTARRDRGLTLGLTDTRQAEGLKELEWYTEKHPQDAIGHYDLAQLTWRDHPDRALNALSSAVRLDPKFGPAQVDLAWLLNRQGRTAEAVPHLQSAIAANPRDARALDQLGAAYIALDRAADAEKPLRQAAAIASDDPQIMMHLGRALMELGHEDEGRQYLEKFQKSHTARIRGAWTQPAMIESASLPAPERLHREIERLRRAADAHSDDPELRLRLASLLLTGGHTAEAEREFRVLLARNAEPRIYHQAGTFLLTFERYQLAREFLERAGSTLDLAIAVFFLDGPAKALAVLDRAPDQQNSGEYWLLKAKILDAAGNGKESGDALDQALRLPISHPQFVRQAALLLVQHHRTGQALDFLTKTSGHDPDLLLTRAMIQAVANQNRAAGKSLVDIESQWPEWDRPYLIHGLLLEKTQPPAAREKLQTAIALGSRDPAATCALARLASNPIADPKCACAAGIQELLLNACVSELSDAR